MPFQYILANLMAETPEAVGVIFFDETGETVELATSGLTPFDLQIVGASLPIYLRQAKRVLDGSRLGEPDYVHIERDALHLQVIALPEGYHLALLHSRPARVAATRRGLEAAASALRREIFQQTS